MNSALPAPFPKLEEISEDYNPAIRLFGKRFIKEQSVLEYLTEFLGLVLFEKWLDGKERFAEPFLPIEELKKWSLSKNVRLKYNLPVKLNLKLFAFLSSSRVESRHSVHEEHYRRLFKILKDKIKINGGNTQEAIMRIEDLLRSYQGAGFNRTWCAKTFFPISKALVTRETIWNASVARKNNSLSWSSSILDFKKYYSISRRDFMARGGELLYLQLCNLFAKREIEVKTFADKMHFHFDEANLEDLHGALQKSLAKLQGINSTSFDELLDYVESLDKETCELSNKELIQLGCEWCPEESWQEGYLFAVEIKRLLQAVLDPVERLQMLMTGCSLQVLRSICAQSVRYAGIKPEDGKGGGLEYSWIFTKPHSPSRQQRLASQRNLQHIQGLIQKSLRHIQLFENASRDPLRTTKQLYQEADNKYGHKLLLSLGKKLGIIVPSRGPGARFIMTDNVLRYMVLVLLSPGEYCTYSGFLERLYRHYGIAVEGDNLNDAVAWCGLPANSAVQTANEVGWLAEMLNASGFLTELSDACSIVRNTFDSGGM
jgi:hypothetical protein